MSKLVRALTLAAILAATSLAGLTTVAQANPADHSSGQADATVRRLLANERSSVPNGAAARPQLLLDEERSALLNLPTRAPAQAAADAAHRRQLAQERYYSTWTYADTPAPAPAPAPTQPQPSPPADWRTPALAALSAVLALVAGVAVLAARRTRRSHRAEQAA
jgi:hypothetical protein